MTNKQRDYAEIRRIIDTSANVNQAFHRLMDRCEQSIGGSKIRFLEAAYTLGR